MWWTRKAKPDLGDLQGNLLTPYRRRPCTAFTSAHPPMATAVPIPMASRLRWRSNRKLAVRPIVTTRYATSSGAARVRTEVDAEWPSMKWGTPSVTNQASMRRRTSSDMTDPDGASLTTHRVVVGSTE